MSEGLRFPTTADEPPYLLLWRIDDVAVPLLGLAGGMLVGHVLPFASAGLLSMFLYRKYRSGRPEFYVLHAMYWAGMYPARGAGFVNPFVRTFLP